jgi:(1->4)-alpha-D-glucan 1-alpha-D-glucosylmutase
MFNALSQTLLKLTAPGVPDVYQGSELWELSLVDPDNRRPVDFALRRRLLAELDDGLRAVTDGAAFARALVDAKEDGRVKLHVIRQALALRRARAALYRDGDYQPIDVAGPLAEHVCAFARMLGAEAALTLAPRLLARRGIDGPPLGRDWWGSETAARVPPAIGTGFRNAFTGEHIAALDGTLALGDVFAHFPVALLVRED